MSITLKFFMIKRGLTIEKLVQKSNATSIDELISYAKSLNISVTEADQSLVKDYFATLAANILAQGALIAGVRAELDAGNTQTAPEKKKRSKKSVGDNV